MMLSDILLAASVLIIVIYGYYVMKRLDDFLHENLKRHAERFDYKENNGGKIHK